MKESVDSILKNYPSRSRDSLIPILQDVQDKIGFLNRDSIAQIGRYLNLPASKIYGVATFYNQFRFEPLGKYHIQVCRGTACHVKGSFSVLETLKQILNIEPGHTTKDGMFSIEVVACMGACGLAPVISVNGEFHAAVTCDDVIKIINTLREGGK
ncbi:NADH-quinone oxidoreductase subunit NuoE [candidate division KSB1 bacterium]|nr:MAG: NADH-quinone oxidoreductase subunit NuoE [candidate division KSB1 bacterium]